MAKRRGQNVVSSYTKKFMSQLRKQQETKPVSSDTFYFEHASPLALLCKKDGSISGYIYERLKAEGDSASKVYKRQVCDQGRLSMQSLDSSRQQAMDMVNAIKAGKDPKLVALALAAEEKAEEERREAIKTLAQMTEIFIDKGRRTKSGRKPYSKGYIKDIHSGQKNIFVDWQDLLLTDITEDMILERYDDDRYSTVQLGKQMRWLRSLYSRAHQIYRATGLYEKNPVAVLGEEGVIVEPGARKVRLHKKQFKPWLEAIFEIGESHDHTSGFRNGRDSTLLFLFTGIRKDMLLSTPLSDVYADEGFIRVPEERSKNGVSYDIPLSDVSKHIVQRRVSILADNHEFLFPGIGKRDFYSDNRDFRKSVNDMCNFPDRLTTHDMRRTFKSIGAELKINTYILNDLVGHERSGADINTSYQVFDRETLQQASQEISDFVVRESGIDVIAALSSCR